MHLFLTQRHIPDIIILLCSCNALKGKFACLLLTLELHFVFEVQGVIYFS